MVERKNVTCSVAKSEKTFGVSASQLLALRQPLTDCRWYGREVFLFSRISIAFFSFVIVKSLHMQGVMNWSNHFTDEEAEIVFIFLFKRSDLSQDSTVSSSFYITCAQYIFVTSHRLQIQSDSHLRCSPNTGLQNSSKSGIIIDFKSCSLNKGFKLKIALSSRQ